MRRKFFRRDKYVLELMCLQHFAVALITQGNEDKTSVMVQMEAENEKHIRC